ncbi:MAG: hypothetical protein J1D89_04190 [Agathobacter sp.]|nr:hypothetical protein [Agathobacter sp.]
MINDLRIGIKLTKYGINATMNWIFGACMLVLGLVMETVEIFGVGVFGISLSMVLLVCGAAIPAQLAISIDVSSLAQSSAYKKKLQTSIPALLMGIGVLAALTLTVVVRGIRVAAGADELILKNTVYSGIIAAMLIVYFAFVYKYYIASIVVLYVALFGSEIFDRILRGWGSVRRELFEAVPTALCIVITYALVLAAVGLQYLVMSALYKKPIAKSVFGAALRRSMQ